VGGGSVTIDSNVSGDIFATGGSLFIDGTADDVRVAGGEMTINGEIKGDLISGAGIVNLNGKVGGDALIGTDMLHFGESAKVGGKLSYATPEPMSAADRVAASSEYFESNSDFDFDVSPPSIFSIFSSWFIRTFLTIISYVVLTGLLLKYRPNLFDRPLHILNNDWAKSAGWGVLYLVILPIVSIVLAIVIGIGFGVGAALATFLVIFSLNFLLSFITPILIGTWLGNQFTESGTTGILVAVAILTLLFALPLVGFIVEFIAGLLVVGSLLLVIRQNNETAKMI